MIYLCCMDHSKAQKLYLYISKNIRKHFGVKRQQKKTWLQTRLIGRNRHTGEKVRISPKTTISNDHSASKIAQIAVVLILSINKKKIAWHLSRIAAGSAWIVDA